MSDIEIGKVYSSVKTLDTKETQPLEEDNNSIFKNTTSKNELDGELGEFSQGDAGVCGLLATFISIINSKKGSEIFQNSIVKTNNGHGVYFKDLNKVFEVTQEESDMAIKEGYVLGLNGDKDPDPDAILLAVAFEKACNESSSLRMKIKKFFKSDYYKDKKSTESENASHFMKLLTGEKSNYKINWLGLGIGNNRLLNKLQNKDYLACANFSTSSKDKIMQTQEGPYVIATPGVGHAYAIKSIDDENVILVNPHYPDKDIIISRKEFSKNVDEIHYLIFD